MRILSIDGGGIRGIIPGQVLPRSNRSYNNVTPPGRASRIGLI